MYIKDDIRYLTKYSKLISRTRKTLKIYLDFIKCQQLSKLTLRISFKIKTVFIKKCFKVYIF